jgi:hypothetical protein
MAGSLSDVLLERLGRETKPQDEWPALVLAAREGEASVDALLNGALSAVLDARSASGRAEGLACR